MSDQATLPTGKDTVTFLKSQHERVKDLFEQVFATRGTARERAFFDLRRLMAVHETAEETIVHPAARRILPDGDDEVTMRLREENEAKKALTELETLDVNSAEFEMKLSALRNNVLEHAKREEREELDRMGSLMDPKRLERMGRAIEIAEAIAPTRPHPGVETATANFIVGPFASMMDRVRDAIEGKEPKHGPTSR
jgi:hemerythrin superfamily protein